MRNFRTFALASVSIVASAGSMVMAAPAFAQDAAADEEASSNDIIVTARRKDENLQDVPLVVQAVTAEDLTKNQIRRLEDVASVVPGLTLARANAAAGGTSTIRGVAFDTNASGAQSTIEFYRNDAVISSGILFQALYDIGQIEVLRGPQGTLRGRATPSGSFTITTRRPDMDEFGGYVSGTIANEERLNFNGAINWPILTDVFAIRLAGSLTSDRGTGVKGVNLFTGAVDSDVYDRGKAFRISARATPLGDVLTLDFNYERIERKQRYYEQVESRGLVEGTAVNGPILINSRDRLGIGSYANTVDMPIDIFNWQAQLNLAGQTLTYVGANQTQVNATFVAGDVASILANPVGSFVLGSFASAPSPWINETYTTSKQTTHEVRLQNQERIAGLFDYVAGYMTVTSASPTLLYTANNPGGSVAAGLTNLRFGGALRFRDAKEVSYFGNLTAHLGDRAEISGGLRRINFKQISGLTSAPGTTNRDTNVSTWPANAAFAVNEDESVTIYNASAKYKVTDDVMVYGTFGTSYRPGNTVICTVCLAFTQAPSALQLSFLRQPDEKSKSFELGLKTAWLDRRLKFNISAYWQKFTNFPVRSGTAIQQLASFTAGTPNVGVLAQPFNFVSANDAKIRGVEAEMAFAVSDNFDISGNLAYAKGKITNGLFPCVDLNNDNVQDATPISAANLQAFVDQVGANRIDSCRTDAATSASPFWSGSAQAEYRHELGNDMKGYLRGLVTWRGSTIGETVNPFDSVSANAVINLFAGVRGPDSSWELSVYAKNVTNTHRVLLRQGARVSSTFGNVPNSNDYYGVVTNTPREFGVSARWAFGSR